ncbi:anti-sigma B factor antagonist [Nocardioides sp. J9]|uniref:STAS domain-containing protein n=1 Tax=unclassified Nocardioides TaxID=2615069 RepID=UPI0004AD2C31|nr:MULTISPECIES: STAS domain-containing protein [unclassified Nocardioides]TWH01650.1 anti-sigma B factor antagonist [Nocardioides sp. J9]
MGATIRTDLGTTSAVLVLGGELDVRSTAELRSALYRHLDEHGSAGDGRVLVDLDDVTSIDETALKVLAAASRRVRLRGGVIVLRGGGPAVRRMLHLTHLARLFELERLPIPA